MSLGNGRMGQRGNLEEGYSGKTLLGNYVAGVYFPDKTRVGWWKNGYPNYFAKVLNACSFSGAPRFWVFAAGLTNVEVKLKVTDTETGQVREYKNPLNRPFQPIQDTDAFASCP